MGREARARAGDGRVLKCECDLPARKSSAQNVGEEPGTRIASPTAIESCLIKNLAVPTGLVGNSPEPLFCLDSL